MNHWAEPESASSSSMSELYIHKLLEGQNSFPGGHIAVMWCLESTMVHLVGVVVAVGWVLIMPSAIDVLAAAVVVEVVEEEVE